MNHEEYGKFNDNLFDFFENIKFNGRDDEIFQLAKPSIYKNLSDYLSHVYDYARLLSSIKEPVYSNHSKIYIDTVWKKKKLSSIPSIEKNYKIYKKGIIKKIYQIFTENFPKNLFKYIVISRNSLIKDFLIKNPISLKLTHPTYLSSSRSKNKVSNILLHKISSLVFSMIEEKYFNLQDEQKQSIEFIIESHLTEADNDLKNYDGFLKNSKNIILDTSTGHYTRLISTIAKNQNSNVWKFDHGGEKCFFDDNFYWSSAFYNTNVFVTYGKKWKKYAEKKAKDLNKDIQVKAIGSNYHKEIFNTHFGKKSKFNKKILYIASSFMSEERHLTYGTIIDPVLYDWQKYLIELLQNFNYDVIYKMHPKGIFHEDNNLGQISTYKSTKHILESFKEAEIVVVDYAGSAFVEALCAGKDVIYIDMKQRQFNKDNFEDLNSIVKIVSTNQHNGVFYVDTEKLLKALKSPQKNFDKQRELVKEYWLESD